MKAHPTPSVKLGQWLGYSGMATAFLAVAPKTEAQIVVLDLDPDAALINDGLNVDFDSDGLADLHINHVNYMGSSSSIASADVNMTGNALIGQSIEGSVYPSVLAFGAPIGPGDPDFHSVSGTASLAYKINVFNSFSEATGLWNGQSGFLGCRFTAGDGAVHYGWVQLSVPTGVGSITVAAFGYETTPDMVINAGDMGLPTGITAASADAFHVAVMPNPTTDRAVISLPETRTAAMRISLLSGTGQMLFTDEVGAAKSYTLDLADQAPGVYFVRLQDGKRVAYSKVVKE